MKKAIVVLLVAVVAMAAVFANTSDKDGFSVKIDAISLLGSYDACYRMGNFEFGIGYLTYGPVYCLVENIYYLTSGEFSPSDLFMFVAPLGALASVEYKFLATEQHEVGVYVEGGWCPIFSEGYVLCAGAEYDFCFNANHAAYAKVGTSLVPYFGAVLESAASIGYRYTF